MTDRISVTVVDGLEMVFVTGMDVEVEGGIEVLSVDVLGECVVISIAEGVEVGTDSMESASSEVVTGVSVGERVGLSVVVEEVVIGLNVGNMEGNGVGNIVGITVGYRVGATVGDKEGAMGVMVGEGVG